MMRLAPLLVVALTCAWPVAAQDAGVRSLSDFRFTPDPFTLSPDPLATRVRQTMLTGAAKDPRIDPAAAASREGLALPSQSVPSTSQAGAPPQGLKDSLGTRMTRTEAPRSQHASPLKLSLSTRELLDAVAAEMRRAQQAGPAKTWDAAQATTSADPRPKKRTN
ncbi:MAG: hypothetical protein HY554_11765 [Elusimicrobia bacterium]|nr:hypothetical protein [Elusimicrobiota bacterium]